MARAAGGHAYLCCAHFCTHDGATSDRCHPARIASKDQPGIIRTTHRDVSQLPDSCVKHTTLAAPAILTFRRRSVGTPCARSHNTRCGLRSKICSYENFLCCGNIRGGSHRWTWPTSSVLDLDAPSSLHYQRCWMEFVGLQSGRCTLNTV